MRRITCVLLLLALTADIAEARRSSQYRSYRFYRDFYEKHKNDDEKPARRRAAPQWGEATPVPYWDCDAVAENGWGTRRIVNWICIGKGLE